MSTALTITSTSIRQDEHGRFCLNDLHKASGGAEKDKPKFWLENKQAAEMQQVLLKGGIPPVKALQGRYGGTYAVKTMVYAYAMWISADFHVAVIEAYDQMVTSGRVQPTRQPVEMTRMEILQLALDSEQKRLEAEAKLAIAAPKAEALDRLASIANALASREAGLP